MAFGFHNKTDTLDKLYKYLEVKPEKVLGAVASRSMLAPLEQNNLPQPHALSSFAAPDFDISFLYLVDSVY